MKDAPSSIPATATSPPPVPDRDVLRALASAPTEEQVKKALAAGQTTVDLLGLRAKLPQ